MSTPASGSPLKLHLGCGKRHIPTFVHVDRVAFPHVDHVRDIRDLSIFRDRSADLIYACQVIEYFDREDLVPVLAEWRRVLRPGGILRLSVPDFAVMTRLYTAGLPLEWFLGTLYGKIPDGSGGFIYHRTTYDEASLRSVLESNGFEGAERWEWRETEHAHVDDFSQAYFPHMEKARGILWNLNMQARRTHDQ
jgi:SAM-dependent methyltransferase